MTPFPHDMSGQITDLCSEWARRIQHAEAGKFASWTPTRHELASYLAVAVGIGIGLAINQAVIEEGKERKMSNRGSVLASSFQLRKKLSEIISTIENG